MLEFALRSEIVRSFEHFDAQRLDLKLLERQACALEAIAAQLSDLAGVQMAPESQPQYLLAKRRLLEETI